MRIVDGDRVGGIGVSPDLSYEEGPVRILDLRGKTIPLVRVQWQRHGVEGSTWERTDEMRAKYPDLFDA